MPLIVLLGRMNMNNFMSSSVRIPLNIVIWVVFFERSPGSLRVRIMVRVLEHGVLVLVESIEPRDSATRSSDNMIVDRLSLIFFVIVLLVLARVEWTSPPRYVVTTSTMLSLLLMPRVTRIARVTAIRLVVATRRVVMYAPATKTVTTSRNTEVLVSWIVLVFSSQPVEITRLNLTHLLIRMLSQPLVRSTLPRSRCRCLQREPVDIPIEHQDSFRGGRSPAT
jgi:hypothetical protein